MSDFCFQTEQFSIDQAEIRLLRNGYCYRKIPLNDISYLAVARGRQVGNWGLLLLFGITLFFIGLYSSVKIIYEFFFANNFKEFHVLQFVFPVIPVLLGGYSIVQSLKNGWVMKFTVDGRTMTLPITKIYEGSSVDSLIQFLQSTPQTSYKFKNEL